MGMEYENRVYFHFFLILKNEIQIADFSQLFKKLWYTCSVS